jgi:hypothetical protein
VLHASWHLQVVRVIVHRHNPAATSTQPVWSTMSRQLAPSGCQGGCAPSQPCTHKRTTRLACCVVTAGTLRLYLSCGHTRTS